MSVHPRNLTLSAVLLIIAGMVVWAPGVTTAQSGQTGCAQLLANVQQHLAAGCGATGRDEVCYGNRQILVEYTDATNQTTLDKEGDIVPLNVIRSLKAGPLNPDSGEWGVAVIKTQPSNLAGTTSGQVVTFIVYGDTTITGQTAPIGKEGQPQAAVTCSGTSSRATYLRGNPGANEPQVQLLQPGATVTLSGRTVDGQWLYAESQGQKGWLFTKVLKLDCDPATLAVSDPTVATLPGVNALYFTTGVGAQSSCKDIPPAGLFIQSPTGVTVTFKLNGADIVMGSTGVFTFKPGGPNQITIWTLSGEIDVIVGGIAYRIPAGNARSFPLGGSDGLQLTGRPGALRAIYYADPLAPAYVRTLCAVARAIGLTVEGCIIKPPPTRPPNTPIPTQNTCQPTMPGLPCNCNGFCDPGESYYTCPQDCPFAPIPAPAQPPAACTPRSGKCFPTSPNCCPGLKCINASPFYYCG